MPRRIHRTLALPIALFLVIVGLPRMLAQTGQPRDRDPGWVAPEKDASRVNPLAARMDAASGGRKIFQQRCTTCHGEDGHGTTKAPDLTQPDVQAQRDGTLFWKISSGNTHAGMPAFSFLPEPQRWQLVLQLRALLTTASPPTP